MTINRNWIKSFLTLFVIWILILLLPESAIDPWGLFNLRKIATMIFALVIIQILGSILAELLGVKIGAILSGFLGGIISSTATTASLARQSKKADHDNSTVQSVAFLSAAAAMHLEAFALIIVGANEFQPILFIIFVGPLVATVAMIVFLSRKILTTKAMVEPSQFNIIPILKIAGFILFIIALSKSLQNLLGQSGLYIITFLVSLFEIHGSIIANIQIHDSGQINLKTLGALLALSILASYFSKVFLVMALGRHEMKKQVYKSVFVLTTVLLISFLVFNYFVSI